MLHPSYTELLEVVNKDAKEGEPIVQSRYSIVMAASKRARQLIAAGNPQDWENGLKPLSVAVEELAESSIKIVHGDSQPEEFDEDTVQEAPQGEA